MGTKSRAPALEETRLQVHAPGGRWVYNVSTEEARYLIRSGQATRKGENSLQLKQFSIPDWMRGHKYTYRESGIVGRPYSLKRIPRKDAPLFGAIGKTKDELIREVWQRLSILIALLTARGYDITESHLPPAGLRRLLSVGSPLPAVR